MFVYVLFRFDWLIFFYQEKKPESSFKRQRYEALGDEKQHDWELPDEFSFYANKFLQKFVEEKKLRDSILNENPVSLNITKPRKLDEYYK